MEPVTALSPIPVKNTHLALVGGLPCAATYFAADLCRDLLFRKHGACEVMILNDLSDATLEKIGTAEHPVLFLTEIPDAAVADAVSQSAFPVLVIDQSFSEASRDFIAARDAKLLDTVRTMARAQIGLNALAAIPRSVLLTTEMTEPAATLARRIAAECDIDPQLCALMIEERNLDRPLSDVLQAQFTYDWKATSDEARTLLDKLDRFYSFHPERRDAIWSMPMGLLVEATPPYLSATNAIDLLGPARCLSFGPYIYLPKGRWTANFTFFASDNRSTNTVGFDITADEEIKLEENFELGQSGKFAIACHFDIENSYYPFEFRTYLRRGSIEGKFELVSLTLEQRD